MEVGLFVQGHVPNHEVAKDPVNAEHDNVDAIVADAFAAPVGDPG